MTLKAMKQGLTFLLVIAMLNSDGQSVFAGFMKTKMHDVFKPIAGQLIVTDTQTVNGWQRTWSQEASIFYDAAAGHTKVYFTGGADSLASSAFNNKIGVTTTTDFINFTAPQKVIGQGLGGAPSGRRATSSWVGKLGNKYYCFALNGYPAIAYAGQDANVYAYSSNDGFTWVDEGMKFNKATAWQGGPLPNTGGGASGFGNTGICTDQFNKPIKINNKYVAIVDVFDGSIWRAFRAEADSLMGNWVLTDALPTMQTPGTGLYGGSQLIYFKGYYYVFYHYTPVSGNLPGYLAYAQSTDCINWTKKEYPIFDNTYNPYGNSQANQNADPFVCEINGKVYMVAEYTDGNYPYPAQVRMWTYPGTFSSLLSQVLW